ncbi:MAG TPA: hypothetical protein VKY74_27745 [Chloroflexia bacterium]|nr:hypothetical protein [Chloroflexia bacterium]
MAAAILVVLGGAWAAILLSWAYFRRYAVTRPPVGVFNLRDISVMIAGIVIVPYLYLLLPLWLVLGLLVLSMISILYLLWEPLLHARPAIWVATLVCVGGDLLATWLLGSTHPVAQAINDGLIVLAVVGVTNLWAQSGMRARDVTILGGILAVYDFTATSVLPLMGEMMTRLAGLPLAPQVIWGSGPTQALIGLGDLLLAAVFPLVMRKAFGRPAGLIALLLAAATIGGLFLLPITTIFPVMVLLGPLMIGQYLYWARRAGAERTTWQYLQAEPR